MMPCPALDPETALLHWLAHYTGRDPAHPAVRAAAAQVQAVAEYGYGQVTFEFSDNQLRFVRPQANLRFGDLRTFGGT